MHDASLVDDGAVQSTLLSGLSRTEVRTVDALGTTIDALPGRAFTTAGQPGHEAFLIHDGLARCLVSDVEVAMLGPGDIFGEIAVLDGGPRTASVFAYTHMTITVFDRSEFIQLVDASPRIGLRLLRASASRLRAVDEQFLAA